MSWPEGQVTRVILYMPLGAADGHLEQSSCLVVIEGNLILMCQNHCVNPTSKQDWR